MFERMEKDHVDTDKEEVVLDRDQDRKLKQNTFSPQSEPIE